MSGAGDSNRQAEPAAPRMHPRALAAAVFRESRAARGRLAFFIGCLAIGVAAVVGVAALVGAVEAGLRGQSRELLGADLRVSASRPLPEEELDAFFADLAHERSDARELAAMASVSEPAEGEAASVLVELKVIGANYPLYGQLGLSTAGVTAADLGATRVFVGPELATALGVRVGDRVSLGGASFEIAAEVLDEPDRLEFGMTFGPRVFMGHAGLERTSLVDAESRVRHRAFYRLEGDRTRDELEVLEQELLDSLSDPEPIGVRTHAETQRSVRRSLGRAEEYLGLVALLSLLLGGIGVSQIVRAWIAGRTPGVAVMRCLGFRAREIAGIYLGHVALLALGGCLVGGALGAALPLVVRFAAPELFEGGLGHLWQPRALLRGTGLGLAVALLFSLPPLTAVWRVPPATVLRAEAAPLPVPRAVRFGSAACLLLGVLASARVQGGEWDEAAWFSGGLVALAALLAAAARGVAWLAARTPRGRVGPYLEHGLAALARPGSGTEGAIVALGLGVLVVASMALVERRLGEALRTALPENAPSIFLVDVQPEQWEGVHASLLERGARSVDMVPVVMARLRAIDARSVDEILEERRAQDRGGRWVLTREQRLTWMRELPEDNAIIEGALWSDPERAEVSLEEDFAEDLEAGLGTELRFDVGGVPVEVTVTSIRTVDWQSFGINFFLVVEPGVLEDAPHMRLAAARFDSPDAEYGLQNALAADYPNVTLLRVRPILEKIAALLERIALGVRALGSFTIVTGLVILAGAVGTTALRRAREAALLKALGVTRAGVTRLFAVEYALGGLVAGAIGALGALGLSFGFLEYTVELEADLPLAIVPVAALATALVATASGLAASARALRARPIDTLRGDTLRG